jgi:hypothetical protein
VKSGLGEMASDAEMAAVAEMADALKWLLALK